MLRTKSIYQKISIRKTLIIFFFWNKQYVYIAFNPIQDGGGKKAPPTSFSPVTSTNVGISPKNFLTFSFNPFDRLV